MRGPATFLAEVLFLLTVAPLLLLAEFFWLSLVDVFSFLAPRIRRADKPVDASAVSVVIPSWNGRAHLEANLASVVAALAGNPHHEILVVDNASGDGTADYVAREFPEVRVLTQKRNLGFGAGSNAGFQAARNDVVVLLNNDMRVEAGFLEPLLEGFREPNVFAVTSQIFFSDPNKRREETGLASGRWENGRLHLAHRVDEEIDELFPTFYAGGGSSAYDRAKFLELGGFDELFAPFYVEDVDLSYLAWKRGWKILYQPLSVVYHEHRGTIGKKFSSSYIERTVHKNNLLFAWKDIHAPGMLAAHFCWLYLTLWVRRILGPSATRPDSVALLRALSSSLRAGASRLRARRLAEVSDQEAMRRPLGGYYRDRFEDINPNPEQLNVLFVSPYPIEPPLHGGGVFMNQTVRRLAELCRLHLFCLLEQEGERTSNERIGEICTSAEFVVRWSGRGPGAGALAPHAVDHFWNPELEWRLHRTMFLRNIDVVQLDYTQLAIYGGEFRRIASFLFEHDVYFQSVGRSIGSAAGPGEKLRHAFEYLRALRFELRALDRFDAVQVCTSANRRYLESFTNSDAPPIEEGYRAGIDVGRYEFVEDGREPDTLLFVGNFRHPPNRAGLEFFLKEAFGRVRERRPTARLIVIGAQAPPGFAQTIEQPGVEYLGEVDDVTDAYRRYSVFLAPILSGSGVRVKLLEAFAVGIPAVATQLGAEGLSDEDGRICLLADTGEAFANAVVRLLEDEDAARELAKRARTEVGEKWDMGTITRRLEKRYREVLKAKAS